MWWQVISPETSLLHSPMLQRNCLLCSKCSLACSSVHGCRNVDERGRVPDCYWGGEIGWPAVGTLILLRLLLGVPAGWLLTRRPCELSSGIGLWPPNWPSSGLRVEGSRGLEINWGRLPKRRALRLIMGPCRLFVWGLRLPAYCIGLLTVSIEAFGAFISRAIRISNIWCRLSVILCTAKASSTIVTHISAWVGMKVGSLNHGGGWGGGFCSSSDLVKKQ